MTANPHRGEVVFETADGRPIPLRPSFAAISAAEASLGPIIAFAARADKGVSISELGILFHHCACAVDEAAPDAEAFGTLILQRGLVGSLAVFKSLMDAILGGRTG